MKILNIGSAHPIIKDIKTLKKHVDSKKAVVEDLATIAFLCEAKREALIFIYAPDLIYSDEAKAILEYYKEHSNECYTVSSQVYRSITEKDNATGFIGVFKIDYLDLNEIKADDYPVIVIGDRIENPGNLGTILRTCDATNVNLYINVDEVVKTSSPKTLAASRGMALFINKVSTSYEETERFLLDNGYTIYLGEPTLGKPHYAYDYKGKIAIVIGNERYGINPKWYDYPHKKVYIPMSGKMGSLNVAIAGSILIYEAYVKRTCK